jgi:Domain of unknown function (DUF4287)/Domain of unknown function (DUF5655)
VAQANRKSVNGEELIMATVKDAIETMQKNIATSTGKTVGEWVAASRKTGFAKHGEILAWLKEKHSVGHGYANFIAKQALEAGDGGEDDLLKAQYSGQKQAIVPLYQHMVTMLKSLGRDVEIAVKKNNVSIRRTKQFALLQPSTATRLDVGLILKNVKPTARLEKSGSFNAMFTHRVRLASSGDLDAELKAWARAAYVAA